MSDIAETIGAQIKEELVLHSELKGLESLEPLRKIHYDLTFRDMQFLPDVFIKNYDPSRGVIEAMHPVSAHYNKVKGRYNIKIYLKNKSNFGLNLANQIFKYLSPYAKSHSYLRYKT